MNDYTKKDFYHFYDTNSNKRRYYLKINETFIEVNKEVYNVCYNSYRKQIRDNRRDHKHGLISYDSVLPDGGSILDTYGSIEDPIDEVYKKDVIKVVLNLIDALDHEEKEFIRELIIKGKKESELAEKYKVSQQTINRKKKRIINTLRNKINQGYKRIKALLF